MTPGGAMRGLGAGAMNRMHSVELPRDVTAPDHGAQLDQTALHRRERDR